jgi:iron complex outermembrane recepter protein
MKKHPEVDILLLLSTTVIALTMQAHAATPSASDANMQLEEVVVTAQRREQNIQDVPVAVSAFTPAEMERRQAFNVVDLVSNVPNLVGNNNIGQGTATTVFLRGLGSTESIVTLETAMGFYIDDVYISRQGVNNLSLFDVERVEVLRGPQGTLYGRNTTAGALKVVTQKPDKDPSGYLEGTYGEYNRWSIKGSGNLPLSDTVFMRASAFIEKGDGYARDLTLGKKVNNRDGYGGRLALRWLPSSVVDVNFSVDYYKSDQIGLYPSDVAGIIRPTTGDLNTVVSGTDTSNIGETYGGALTVNWQLNDALQLQSITGYRKVYQKWNLDLTDQVDPVYVLYTINDTKSYSEELKLNGNVLNNRLKFTTGVFAYKESNFSFIGDQINLWFPFGRVPLPFFGRNYDLDVKSYALFAEGEFAITDKLNLIAGARYTKDKKDLTMDARVGGTVGYSLIGGAPNYNNATLNALGVPTNLDFNKFTPKVGLQYKFTDDVNAYLTYSKGWKSGGWSARTNDPTQFVVFDPETVNSYELGVKTTLLDGRIRSNYTGFYYDYKNFFSTANGTNGNFIVFTSDAKFYGLEWDAVARLTDRLDAFGAAGFEQGSYNDLNTSVFGTSIGSTPQRMPKWNAKLGATYTWPLAQGSSLRFTADYQFVKDHFTNLQDSELARSGDIKLVNASIAYELPELRYTVTLGCRNCFDHRYISQSLDFSGIAPNSKQWDGATFNGLSFLTVYAGPPKEW